MTPRERFLRVMSFQPVDRLPLIEWATWWDKTIERWKSEGMPQELEWPDIGPWLGLDVHLQHWQRPRGDTYTSLVQEHGPVVDMDSYLRVRPGLYPREDFHEPTQVQRLEHWARRQASGEAVVWISLEGFFWFPRTLFGIEQHLYAFYDHPDVMHRMNQDLLEFHLDFLDALYEIIVPDFMTFAEDMSYRSGPMCSKDHFDEFMAPYYRQIVPRLKQHGVLTFVDTDGDCTELVPWFREVGVDGMLPLERQAGVDVALLRERYPDLLLIGGFNKMVMNQGEAAVRAEFERLLPVMRQGGFIPACDHQTPPGVSLDQYRSYVALWREYAVKGARR